MFPHNTFPQGEFSPPPPLPPEPVARKKKPLYKKWWAWLIAILIIGGIGSTLGNDGEDDALTSSSAPAASVEATDVPHNNQTPVTATETPTNTDDEASRQIEEEASKKVEEAAATAAADSQPETTLGQSNAAKKARDYLKFMPFSRSGLIEQLEFEGFTTEDATYAVDNVTVDWNEQAAQKAQEYLDFMAFSREELIGQLVFEGFSQSEAEYGATAVGY